MNKFKIFIVVLFSCVSIYAQQQKDIEVNIENLSKKWEMVDLINPKFSPEELEETKSMLEGTYIEFRDDATFTFSFVLDLDGTWQLNNNIITTEDRKGKNTWTIHSLESKKLIASRNKSEQKIIFENK